MDISPHALTSPPQYFPVDDLTAAVPLVWGAPLQGSQCIKLPGELFRYSSRLSFFVDMDMGGTILLWEIRGGRETCGRAKVGGQLEIPARNGPGRATRDISRNNLEEWSWKLLKWMNPELFGLRASWRRAAGRVF